MRVESATFNRQREADMPARAPLLIQLVRLMRWAALFSLVLAAVALALLARGDSGERAYRFIATALAVGLTVLLAMAVMTLRQFRDRDAADSIKKECDDPRS